MKTLQVSCDHYNGRMPQNLNQFFEILNQKGPQLEKLILGKFNCFISTGSYDPQFFESVANFLKGQKRLKMLKFASTIRMMFEDGLKLLEAAAVFGKHSIEILDKPLAGCGLNEAETARLIEIISSFENLKSLTIDSPTMDILRGISQAIAPKLELLEISFCNELRDFFPLSRNEWLSLKRVYRNIWVSHYVTLRQADMAVVVPHSVLLPAEMPLKELEISSYGHNVTSVKSLCDYVADTFKNGILDSLILNAYIGMRDDVAAEVIAFIQKVPNLKKISMKGSDFPNNLVQFLDNRSVKKFTYPDENMDESESIITWHL